MYDVSVWNIMWEFAKVGLLTTGGVIIMQTVRGRRLFW